MPEKLNYTVVTEEETVNIAGTLHQDGEIIGLTAEFAVPYLEAGTLVPYYSPSGTAEPEEVVEAEGEDPVAPETDATGNPTTDGQPAEVTPETVVTDPVEGADAGAVAPEPVATDETPAPDATPQA